MTEFRLGYNAIVEAVYNGHDPMPVVIAAYKPLKGRAVMAGVLSAIAAALNVCTHDKVTFTLKPETDPTTAEIIGAAPGLRVLLLQNMLDDLHPPQAKIPPGSPDPELERARAAWTSLNGVCEVVYAASTTEVMRDRFAQGLKPRTAGPAAPTAKEALQSPLQVEIISMPERITSTTVARDGQGDIAETRQVEKDAA